MKITIVTPPDRPAVELATLKTHLRLNSNAEDDLLTLWLYAATETITDATGYTGITTTYKLTVDEIPCYGYQLLPRFPVSEVLEVENTESNGNTGLLSDWWLDKERSLLMLSRTYVPTTTRALNIKFKAGVDTELDVNKKFKTLVLLLASHYYANREAYTTEKFDELPQGFEALCQQFRGSFGINWNVPKHMLTYQNLGVQH